MRLIISWVVGILLFILMFMLQEFLGDKLGITTYVDYGETVIVSNRYYEEEFEGQYTVIGWFFGYLSFVVAIRGGMAVFYGKINANVSKKDNFILLLIGVGLLIYGILNQLIYFVFDFNSRFLFFLDTAVAIGIGYACYKFYKFMINKIEQKILND